MFVNNSLDPNDLKLPPMLKVRQRFAVPAAISPEQEVESQFARLAAELPLGPGSKVAVGVGSRGISGLAEVVRSVVKCLRSVGAEPFITPAMGSHGGASAEGQIEVLRHRGVTEGSCGAPVKADMEVVSLGRTDCGIPLFQNRLVNQADGFVLINRVKPHTNFIGRTESGILKMAAIGLGNQVGAEHYHRLSLVRPQYEVISRAGAEALKRSRFLFGAAMVENQDHQLCTLKLAGLDRIEDVEAELLVQAKSLLPRLPVENIDLLIIDEMGKDISGQGIDPNVVGRDCCVYGAKREKPVVSRIHLRGLTKAAAGNAVGIGMADFALKRVIDSIDFPATIINCLTACAPEAGKSPLAFDTDVEAVAAGLMSIRPFTSRDLGIVYIKNTLELSELYLSGIYRESLAGDPAVEIVADKIKLEFKDGILVSPFRERGL